LLLLSAISQSQYYFQIRIEQYGDSAWPTCFPCLSKHAERYLRRSSFQGHRFQCNPTINVYQTPQNLLYFVSLGFQTWSDVYQEGVMKNPDSRIIFYIRDKTSLSQDKDTHKNNGSRHPSVQVVYCQVIRSTWTPIRSFAIASASKHSPALQGKNCE
jgi:hypothetical protein